MIEGRITAGTASVDDEIGDAVGDPWRLGTVLALTRWGQAHAYALRGCDWIVFANSSQPHERIGGRSRGRSARRSATNSASMSRASPTSRRGGWFDETIVKFNEAVALSADPGSMTHLTDAYLQKAHVQPTPEGTKHFLSLAQRALQRARDYEIARRYAHELDKLAAQLVPGAKV